jgi:hypothetical protein
MKTKTIYFFIFFLLLTVYSCSDSDGASDQFLGSKDFTFNAAIDPTTLTQEDNFRIHDPNIAPRDETYAIESQADLDAFNQTVDANDQVSLDDLDVYTYFFIRDPDCPEYYDYSDHSYSNNILIITIGHFREPPDIACPAWITELYLVFRAEKSS